MIVDVVEFLEKEPFQEHKGRIGIRTFTAVTDGIKEQKNLMHLRPVDVLVDLFESVEAEGWK